MAGFTKNLQLHEVLVDEELVGRYTLGKPGQLIASL